MANAECRLGHPRGWTPELRTRFIESLARSGDVRRSAQACSLSRQSVYRLRQRDAAFAKAWEGALAGRRALAERDRLRELERLNEMRAQRPHPSAARARFFEALARVLGGDQPPAEEAGIFVSGHRHSGQLVSTSHLTQSSPICS